MLEKNNALLWSSADGQSIMVRQLRVDELGAVYEINKAQLGVPVAPIEEAAAVLRHNADAFWGVYRSGGDAGPDEKLAGYLAFLPLNAEGAAALDRNELDRSRPPLASIARTGERPAVQYVWAVVAKKLGAAAIPLAMHAMGALFDGVPFCGTAATEAGLRGMLAYGFKPKTEGKDGIGDIFWSAASRARFVPDQSPTVWDSRFKAVVARSSAEVEQALAIRAAVFMVEQQCPYDEEFDGNDRTGTHILGFVEGEPAATMRIRYFADFVKIERLAVLPRFRGTLIAKEVVDTGLNFCRRKGYRKMYGHAQRRLVPFWARFGFRPIEASRQFVFSDHEYVEVEGDLPAHPNPITIASDPYIFLRPEGNWDEPGILERSAERSATNPI